MKCEVCKEHKEKTLRRKGGTIPLERKKNQVRNKDFADIAHPYKSVCLECVERKIRDGGFVPANIIRNSSMVPSGDPLEWVLNGLEEEIYDL